MKTMIDIDEEALEAAARELGTTTKKDTVNAALRFVAERPKRIARALNSPLRFGAGSDIFNPDIMKDARR